MERRRTLRSEVESVMNDWELIDTITITPAEKNKEIDFAKYKYKTFLLHGDIPKTNNETYLRCGVGNINVVQPKYSNKTYASEMVAKISIVDERIVGFCGFEQGFGGANVCGTLIPSPRSGATTSIKFSFYPYVDGSEKATIKVYGR